MSAAKAIAILDYGLGNLRSVSNALHAIDQDAFVSRDSAAIRNAGGLIIPGVGAFPHAMRNLSDMGLVDLISRYIDSGRPVLGICLGMQLLFNSSTEFWFTEGLRVIPGTVDRIRTTPPNGRLPHIAWSSIRATAIGKNSIFAGLSQEQQRFYFVHSYTATQVPPEYVSANAEYLACDICAAVQRDNVWGTQFHPEKSGPNGLHVLKNFAGQL